MLVGQQTVRKVNLIPLDHRTAVYIIICILGLGDGWHGAEWNGSRIMCMHKRGEHKLVIYAHYIE